MNHFQFCKLKIEWSDTSRKYATYALTGLKEHIQLSSTGGAKWYLLEQGGSILYVGFTIQSIRRRLYGSFYAYHMFREGEKSTNGYSGYKWIKELKESGPLKLTVIIPEKLSSGTNLPNEVAFYEAVESELVYEIRTATGMWPIFQNEIHFNNEYQEANQVAKDILKGLTEEQSV